MNAFHVKTQMIFWIQAYLFAAMKMKMEMMILYSALKSQRLLFLLQSKIYVRFGLLIVVVIQS